MNLKPAKTATKIKKKKKKYKVIEQQSTKSITKASFCWH